MSAESKPISRSKEQAIAFLPCDGISRYRVKGSILEIRLPYSTAYNETFKISGGYEQPGLPGSKPSRVFTPEAMRRISKLNQLHLPHAKRWMEAQQAGADLTRKPPETVRSHGKGHPEGFGAPPFPAEIDKPVEHATPEPCLITSPTST